MVASLSQNSFFSKHVVLDSKTSLGRGVPMRHQLADPLTKSGRREELHVTLETGKVTLRECSAKR